MAKHFQNFFIFIFHVPFCIGILYPLKIWMFVKIFQITTQVQYTWLHKLKKNIRILQISMFFMQMC